MQYLARLVDGFLAKTGLELSNLQKLTIVISLGIGQIVADEAADQPDRATGSSRD